MPSRGVADPVPTEARVYQGRRAGVVTRTVASVVDGLVVAAIEAIGYLTWAGLRFMVNPLEFSFPDPPVALIVPVAVAVLVLYLTVGWAASGRTYGNLLMGLRVLGPWGRRLSLPAALLRALACALLPIGLLWCAVDPSNRSLQDVVLRTIVIYDWRALAAQGRPHRGSG
jgi:uncharacterized RDD family membrane protein YckC